MMMMMCFSLLLYAHTPIPYIVADDDLKGYIKLACEFKERRRSFLNTIE